MRQKLSVRALIKIDEKVLLIRRAGGNPKYIGQFELPGGKVEYGEAPDVALRREVVEELGVGLDAMQLYRVVSWMDTMERETQHVIIVFLVGLHGGGAKIALSAEHDKYAWKKLSNIQQSELNILTQVVLEEELQQNLTDESTEQSNENAVLNSTNMHEKEVTVYADGGSRGNPGPSASGFVIFSSEGAMLFEGGKYLGITTNNQAEYQAVKFGLEKALELGAKVVNFRLDSQLVTNQLIGVYQIKNRDLWPIHATIKELSKKFERVTFTHVRREFNKDADAMVNKILDQHQ